jgi:ketosteroid isomerase-like protein
MKQFPIKHVLVSVSVIAFLAIAVALLAWPARNSPEDDAKTVAALDNKYQAAVKVNDANTMSQILADDFILVTGSGKTYTKTDFVNEARHNTYTFERNDELAQQARVWGDTAVVTAKLWEKGTTKDGSFDRVFWFSDTYVRTPNGWRYVFGQSSLPLPKPL